MQRQAFYVSILVIKSLPKEGDYQAQKNLQGTQAFAFLVKSMQVWQLQSEKRHISQPKQTQEVQPLQVGEREHPLYTLRLARSSSSSQLILHHTQKSLQLLIS